MKKTIFLAALIAIFLIFLAGYQGCKKDIKSAGLEDASAVEWVTVDEYYVPMDYIEEFIKNDSAQKGLLPVQIKNYGSNAAVLRKFKGTHFAGPNDAQLKMIYDGLGEWKIIDLKYKNEDDKDIQRTILYVYVNGSWMVGDSGSLVE